MESSTVTADPGVDEQSRVLPAGHLITIAVAAWYLGVSRHVIAHYINSGVIPADAVVTNGKRRRIQRRAVLAISGEVEQ